MDDRSGNTAGSTPASISDDVMPGNNVSARMPAKDTSVADESEKEKSRRKSARSSASGKAQLLPGRMWVIVGAGLTIWIVIAIAVMILFF